MHAAHRLDHAALETAAGLALAALGESRRRTLWCSKFGKREIEGHGFRRVVRRSVELGVPVLVGISGDHAEGFPRLSPAASRRSSRRRATSAIAGLLRGKVEAAWSSPAARSTRGSDEKPNLARSPWRAS